MQNQVGNTDHQRGKMVTSGRTGISSLGWGHVDIRTRDPPVGEELVTPMRLTHNQVVSTGLRFFLSSLFGGHDG